MSCMICVFQNVCFSVSDMLFMLIQKFVVCHVTHELVFWICFLIFFCNCYINLYVWRIMWFLVKFVYVFLLRCYNCWYMCHLITFSLDVDLKSTIQLEVSFIWFYKFLCLSGIIHDSLLLINIIFNSFYFNLQNTHVFILFIF